MRMRNCYDPGSVTFRRLAAGWLSSSTSGRDGSDAAGLLVAAGLSAFSALGTEVGSFGGFAGFFFTSTPFKDFLLSFFAATDAALGFGAGGATVSGTTGGGFAAFSRAATALGKHQQGSVYI